MKMKLTKIVYDHTDDGVKVVNHYTPCADDYFQMGMAIDGYSTDARFAKIYTPDEWNDVLYWIRNNRLAIDVVKAIDEVTGTPSAKDFQRGWNP